MTSRLGSPVDIACTSCLAPWTHGMTQPNKLGLTSHCLNAESRRPSVHSTSQPKLGRRFHTIARAETFAVLQALRIHAQEILYVDNSGVVSNVKRILRQGYHPLAWRTVPNNDVWPPIAQTIVSRPRAWTSIVKVKSHLKVGDHMSREDAG